MVPEILALAAESIDGVSVNKMDQIKLLLNAQGYRFLASTISAIGSGSSSYTALEILNRAGVKVMGSAKMPDTDTTSGEVVDVLRAVSGPLGIAVCPVWNGFSLIRDPYSSATHNQVNLTASMLFDYKTVRSPFSGSKMRLSA